MDILKELQTIFQDVFDDDNLLITDETNATDIEDWDSLAQIRLMAAIEKHFDVKFNFGELQSASNVGNILQLIKSKRN